MSIFVFFKQKTACEMLRGLVGSEMCIRDSSHHDAEPGSTTSASSAVLVRKMSCTTRLSLIHI